MMTVLQTIVIAKLQLKTNEKSCAWGLLRLNNTMTTDL